YLYFLVPKVVLFREEHSRRSLVARVDFVSAPGRSPQNVYRTGGPKALVTSHARFSFDGRFRLQTIPPGPGLREIPAVPGFEFHHAPAQAETIPPSKEELSLIRGRVREEVAETYPRFAASLAIAPG